MCSIALTLDSFAFLTMGGSKTHSSESVKDRCESDSLQASMKTKGLNIEGYPVEGLSIGGHETCIIFPTLKLAFDIGRCPQRAISQDFLFISHAHMDHIVSRFRFVFTELNAILGSSNFILIFMGFSSIYLCLPRCLFSPLCFLCT